MAKWYHQALSFGAAGRVEVAVKDYQDVYGRAQALAIRIEARREEVASILERLVSAKKACLRVLARIKRISNNLGAKERRIEVEVPGEEPPALSLARIQTTLDAANVAKSAAKGLAAGASTAMGAWALAGAYGTASTGTALATLSGAAAQSATLAWFGGGSLATGGMGVAGGAAMIGGIVAVPAVAVMAILAHSKANKEIAKIERESAKLEKAIDDMLKLGLVIDLAEQRANELAGVIRKAREGFEYQYLWTHRRLYPWGWFSKARRWLRRRLGGRYFEQHEMKDIQRLLQGAAEFAGILDQRVFESDGSVGKGTT